MFVFKGTSKKIGKTGDNKKKRPVIKRKKDARVIQPPLSNGEVTVYNFGQVSLNT